jgi:hypothetical protein
MRRTLIDPFELRRTEPRPAAATLLDPFEVRGRAYRARAATLHDPFELRNRFESLDLEVEWEEATRDKCHIVVEAAPRGVRHEAWVRGRGWCDDDWRETG